MVEVVGVEDCFLDLVHLKILSGNLSQNRSCVGQIQVSGPAELVHNSIQSS